MLDNLYIHKITALRYSNSGQDTLGTFVSSSSPVSSSLYIPCRIESYSEETQYNEGGLRKKNKTIIYIPPQYILMLNDEITNYDTNEYIGLVYGINPAIKAFSTDIDHWEIILENK
jgi:hypothetical protein